MDDSTKTGQIDRRTFLRFGLAGIGTLALSGLAMSVLTGCAGGTSGSGAEGSSASEAALASAQIEVLIDAASDSALKGFSKVAAFNKDGLAPVIISEKLAFVDYTGKVITQTSIACKSVSWIPGCDLVYYETTGSSYENPQGIADTSGNKCIEETKGLHIPDGCSEGLICCNIELEYVRTSYGFAYTGREVFWLDEAGEVTIPQGKFSKGSAFHEGLAEVIIDSDPVNNEVDYGIGGGFIDKTGNMVISKEKLGLSNDSIGAKFSNGRALASNGLYTDAQGQRHSGHCLFDTEGTILVKPGEYDYIAEGNNGTYIVKKRVNGADRYGLIDDAGTVLIAPEHYNLRAESGGLYAYLAGEDQGSKRWGFMDKTGKTIVTPEYLTVTPFAHGLSYVSTVTSHTTAQTTVIDTQGATVQTLGNTGALALTSNAATGSKTLDPATGKISEVRALTGNFVELRLDGSKAAYILMDNTGTTVVVEEFANPYKTMLLPVFFADTFCDTVPGVIIAGEIAKDRGDMDQEYQFSRIYNYAGEGIYPYQGVPELDASYKTSDSQYLWTKRGSSYGVIKVV